MDCPYCGAKNRDRAKFCRSCAKRLDGKESAQSEENDESESVYTDSDQVDELVKPASRQKKKVVFGVVVLVALSVGTWVLLGRSQHSNTPPPNLSEAPSLAPVPAAPPPLDAKAPQLAVATPGPTPATPPPLDAKGPDASPQPSVPPPLDAAVPPSAVPPTPDAKAPQITASAPPALDTPAAGIKSAPPPALDAPSTGGKSAPAPALDAQPSNMKSAAPPALDTPPSGVKPATPPALDTAGSKSATPPSPDMVAKTPEASKTTKASTADSKASESNAPDSKASDTQKSVSPAKKPVRQPTKQVASSSNAKKSENKIDKEDSVAVSANASTKARKDAAVPASRLDRKSKPEPNKTLALKQEPALASLQSTVSAKTQAQSEFVRELQACADKSFLVRPFCEGEVRAKYCPGKWGTIPECPKQEDRPESGG